MERFCVFDAEGLPMAFFSEDINGPYEFLAFGDAPEPTEEDPSPTRPIVGRERNPAIPADAVALTDAQWRDFVENSGRRRWNGVDVESYEPPPAPLRPPTSISDRQFAQVLALDGVITQPEALAWAARGELPQKLKDALAQIPEADGQRFGAEMMLSAATVYERAHPLVPTLGALLGYDAAALDDLWTRGAAL